MRTKTERHHLQEALLPFLLDWRQALGASLAVGLCMSPFTGLPFVAGWVLLNLALVFGPGRWLARRLPHGEPWEALSLVYLFVCNTVLSSIALTAATKGGVWGMLNGEILLAGFVCFVSGRFANSRIAYFVGLAPHAAGLLIMPLIALQRDPDLLRPVVLLLGTLSFVISGIVDQNRQRRAFHDLEEAHAKAEAATEAKSAFVALVSHELRTPLSGILAGAAEVQRAATERQQIVRSGLILDSARMMRTLLDDLLDLAKLEAGKMQIEPVDFDLRELVAGVVRFWRPQATARGLKLRVTGVRALPAAVRGDPTRLRQILNNLISNALKFTEAGAITLAIESEATPDHWAVSLSVIDTGRGMDAEQLLRLFQPYEQLSSSTARTHGGTGLGLTISRELARAMGGELSVESEPGQGSSFRLALALAPAVDLAGAQAAQADLAQPLNILVVDDHPVNRQAVTLMLGALGCRIATAGDGEEGLLALAETPYDLVLMDVNMPRLNGLETVRRLRAGAGPNQATPVIALTGSVMPAEVEKCFAAGMNGFAQKPIEPVELIGAINAVLEAGAASTERRAIG